MGYHILVDIVIVVHLAFMAYVIFGELLTVVGILLRWQWIRNFWFRVSHLASILIVAAEALCDIKCPLTVLQERLLLAAGEEASSRSFVEQILDLVMNPGTVEDMAIFTAAYVSFAVLVLLTFVIAPPRLPWKTKKSPPAQQPARDQVMATRSARDASSCPR